MRDRVRKVTIQKVIKRECKEAGQKRRNIKVGVREKEYQRCGRRKVVTVSSCHFYPPRGMILARKSPSKAKKPPFSSPFPRNFEKFPRSDPA